MNRYLLNISYIGTNFRGIQKVTCKAKRHLQDSSTVQGCLETALELLKPANPIFIHLSSRTDAGVHALHSTVHVDLVRPNGQLYSCSDITGLLNIYFDRNNIPIRILSSIHVPNDFHCRYNAKARTYIYRLAVAKRGAPKPQLNAFKRICYIPIEEMERCFFLQDSKFDLDIAKKTLNMFKGFHDFRTFMGVQPDNEKQARPRFTLRYINEIHIAASSPTTIAFEKPKANSFYNYWDITVTGRSFLNRQVRRMVGCLIAAASGRISHKDVYEMITIPSKYSWNPRIMVVPPFALYLCKVHYDEADFRNTQNILEN